MNRVLFAIFGLLIFNCRNNENYQLLNSKVNSIPRSTISAEPKDEFYSFMGIDSIAKADYVFVDDVVDSISIQRCVFKAIYLTCFKGRIRLQNYQYLKSINPAEFMAISNIHTAHSLIIEGRKLSFNGKGKMGCLDAIPEGTIVAVGATIYSFYSNKMGLGQFIILDSIKKRHETIKNHKPPEREPIGGKKR